MSEIADRYDPSIVESRWYREWETRRFFPRRWLDQEALLHRHSPTHVTGSLHWGARAHNTSGHPHPLQADGRLQRPLGARHRSLRHRRPRPPRAPLAEEGRRGRTSAVRRSCRWAWKWKEESGGNIIRQLKRLGASCDCPASASRWTRDWPGPGESPSSRSYEEGLLPGRLHRQLVPALPDGALGPRGRARRPRRRVRLHQLRSADPWSVRPETQGRGNRGAGGRGPPKDKRIRQVRGQIRSRSRGRGPHHPQGLADTAVDPKFGTGVIKVPPPRPRRLEIGRRHNCPRGRSSASTAE